MGKRVPRVNPLDRAVRRRRCSPASSAGRRSRCRPTASRPTRPTPPRSPRTRPRTRSAIVWENGAGGSSRRAGGHGRERRGAPGRCRAPSRPPTTCSPTARLAAPRRPSPTTSPGRVELRLRPVLEATTARSTAARTRLEGGDPDRRRHPLGAARRGRLVELRDRAVHHRRPPSPARAASTCGCGRARPTPTSR